MFDMFMVVTFVEILTVNILSDMCVCVCVVSLSVCVCVCVAFIVISFQLILKFKDSLFSNL